MNLDSVDYIRAFSSRCSSAIRSLRLSCSVFPAGVHPVKVASRIDSNCCSCKAVISALNSLVCRWFPFRASSDIGDSQDARSYRVPG
jgi:hypothetical protein